MPPEAVDLVSRLLQYSPNLRCTAVSVLFMHYHLLSSIISIKGKCFIAIANFIFIYVVSVIASCMADIFLFKGAYKNLDLEKGAKTMSIV